MAVLQLTKHYPPFYGGIESVTYDLTEGLNKRGVKCDVLCSNNTNKSVEETASNGYRIYRAAQIKKVSSASISPTIIQYLRKLAPDYELIHVHYPDPMTALALRLVNPQCPIVVHWHSDIVKQKMLYKFVKPLESWLLKRADAVIATSENYLNSSICLAPYRNKVEIAPIGIPAELGAVDMQAVEAIKSRYNHRKIVFALGRHVYYKGFENLIDAAKLLDDSHVIVIGGIGELTQKYEQQIKANGLENKVILRGRISTKELPNYYLAAELFCLPSVHRSEAFGVVLIEALKFGLPVVATDIPGSGVNWVSADSVTGFNVPINDAAALALAISKITSDPLLRAQFAENAQKRFYELFTADKMVEKVEALYNKLLQRS